MTKSGGGSLTDWSTNGLVLLNGAKYVDNNMGYCYVDLGNNHKLVFVWVEIQGCTKPEFYLQLPAFVVPKFGMKVAGYDNGNWFAPEDGKVSILRPEGGSTYDPNQTYRIANMYIV